MVFVRVRRTERQKGVRGRAKTGKKRRADGWSDGASRRRGMEVVALLGSRREGCGNGIVFGGRTVCGLGFEWAR